jgi:hypothetical protein
MAPLRRTGIWRFFMASRAKTIAVLVGIAAWCAAVFGTFAYVWRYKTTPGPSSDAPSAWPRASVIVPAPDRANLVFFAHPRCPCTRASVSELERLATQLGNRAQLHVVFIRPPGTEPGFEEGVLAERARAIPNARVLVDDGGHEAERFGARTSGATVLYLRTGKLAFSGGITSARGHEGTSPAHSRILAAVERDAAATVLARTPTFGCELMNPETLSTSP